MKGSKRLDKATDYFDAEFYAARYKDVAHLKQNELEEHYAISGREEGRFSNLAQNIIWLENSFGALPPKFDPLEYRDAHDDLRKLKMSAWDAAEHYLKYGRNEGRPYFRFSTTIYRELYFESQIVSDADVIADYENRGRAEGRIHSGDDLMRARSLDGGGRWIEAIKPDEFTLLNFSWAGEVPTRSAAFDAMLSQGITRLAPLSFDLSFDAVFYREAHTDLSSATDEECYRRWLFIGFDMGEAGSQQQFFKDLDLALETYPTSFNWKRYLNGPKAGDTRWSALQSFILTGLSSGAWPIEGDGAGSLLKAIGLKLRRVDDRLAIKAFEMARERGQFNTQVAHDIADCYYRLEKWNSALEFYGLRLSDPGADVWAFCNAARAALKLGEFDLSFRILWQGKDRVVGSPEWRKTVEDAINAEFEAACDKARFHIRMALREGADELVAAAVSRAAERFEKFDPLGITLRPGQSGKVVILANVDLRQCTHYRVEQKQRLLEYLEREFEIFPASEADSFISALPGASAAIFYRLPAFPKNVRAIEVARALGIPTFYDIDDLIFDSQEYPEPLSTYGGGINVKFYEALQFGVPLFRAAMSLCDYGISSTSILATHMMPIVRKKEVYVLPNGLDHRNEFFLRSPPARVRHDGSILIFYGSGTKAHNSDFLDLAGPALVEVMLRNPKVRLMIVGYLTLDTSFEAVQDRIVRIHWVPDIYDYWSLLAEADISIAVLARYPTTDAKSEIKWLEAAAMGIPSVVSGTAHYREVLDSGVDALIADSPEEWTAALERLVVDAELRAQIGANAREKAGRIYSVEANARKFAAFLPKPPRVTLSVRAQKKRILLVNIFFPPQTLGGSTRVMRDNLDCFLDSDAAQRFEFAVVTTDLGNEGGESVRVENYRNCPVFRISTPSRPPMEWWPNHPHIGRWFNDILGIWHPNLVHFHCVQRLSGAIVEACAAAEIPYINSVHDAWWLSDWQFLTDVKDRLRDPREPLPLDPPPSISVGQALDRRRYLMPLLEGSAAILGVSEAFAAIYRSCGFERTVAVPNGTPPLKATPRVASISGRVRLAHVGSITKFKGYHLVQAVLKQSRFNNLELTVVDHSRYGGEERHAKWGATEVRFVGKTIQEQMHEFYSTQDVLLAPSLWPEPFGLVSREALFAGLWVVASDRGAIGENVTSGVNGWIVDVTTPAPLIEVLAQINEAPNLYRRSPPPLPLRTAKDQADDLVEIYDNLLARPRDTHHEP